MKYFENFEKLWKIINSVFFIEILNKCSSDSAFDSDSEKCFLFLTFKIFYFSNIKKIKNIS